MLLTVRASILGDKVGVLAAATLDLISSQMRGPNLFLRTAIAKAEIVGTMFFVSNVLNDGEIAESSTYKIDAFV